MPQSDRFHFRVGDLVRDRLTNDEGRVINVAAIGGNVFVVTIGFLTVRGALKNRKFKIAAGQVGGFIEKVTTTPIGKSARVSSPRQGGAVSARLVDEAKRNIPPETITRKPGSLLKEIQQGYSFDGRSELFYIWRGHNEYESQES